MSNDNHTPLNETELPSVSDEVEALLKRLLGSGRDEAGDKLVKRLRRMEMRHNEMSRELGNLLEREDPGDVPDHRRECVSLPAIQFANFHVSRSGEPSSETRMRLTFLMADSFDAGRRLEVGRRLERNDTKEALRKLVE